jgi:predicted AlkP superfamily pyrophosphatase or phosphodiesterase
MMSLSPKKFLLVGFDGLRPDMVTQELMPRLYQHGQEGVTFCNHRSSFPTETYVNLPSLVTGSTPSRHGMIANYYLDPKVDPREPFRGNSVPRIEKAQHAYGGQLYEALSLGEILQSAQRRMAVISTNSAGSVRLKHHQVFDHDHLSMASHSPETSYPRDEVAGIVEKLGRLSKMKVPDIEGLTYSTDVFFEHLCKGDLPDLTILWYGEPDESYHHYGIGSAENLQALQHVDAEFGRVLDWWEASDFRESLQIVVTSDHGHITQKTKVNIGERLGDAGFKVGDHLEDGDDLALIAAHAGCIWVRDKDSALIGKIAQALMLLDECGMIFTAPRNEVEGIAPGSFSKQLVMADHARSPDIYYILQTSDELNEHGYIGTCHFQSGLPVGGGIHGGLNAKELHSLCSASGSLFGDAKTIDSHSGIFDIAPTILQGLGIAIPPSMDGRVLNEAFAQPPGGIVIDSVPERHETGSGQYQQVLLRTRLGNHCYLDGGWRGD